MKDTLEEAKHTFLKECPVVHALEIIGGKWRIPVIWELSTKKVLDIMKLKEVYQE